MRLINLLRSVSFVAFNMFWKLFFWLKLREKGSAINFPFRGNGFILCRSKKIIIGPSVTIRSRAHLSIINDASLSIGRGTAIGHDFVISCANRIDIGKNVLIADRCCVLDSEHDYKDISRPILLQKMTEGAVKIEDDCWIGINVVILPDVTIGRHSVIGANSVVTMDVPEYSVVCGIPARVIKQYDSKEGKWIPAKGDVLGKGTS